MDRPSGRKMRCSIACDWTLWPLPFMGVFMGLPSRDGGKGSISRSLATY